MNSIEVLIIGAGAAGSSAAFHLANSGVQVTIVDKKHGFLLKPCGGGMAASVQKWFPFSLEPIIEEVIQKVEFTWCLSDHVIAQLPGSSPFWITRREKLDELITQKAIEQGATLLQSFEVVKIFKIEGQWIITSKDGQQLKSKCVVIADGSSSPWAREFNLGPKNLHYASTTSIRVNGKGLLKEGTSRFEFGLVHHGFAWAFPLKDSVNIGVGTFIGNHAVESEKILNELMPSLGFDPKAGIRNDSRLRVWNGHSNLHGDGILVIGDAASLCDPFLAEGLRPALLSGCEAAKCIINWLKGNTTELSSYTKSMKKKWGDSMAWGRRISQVFYRFPKIGYQLGIKRPTAPQRIAQILSGEMGYGDIAQRVIKRLILKS
ncbi:MULTISPECIES: NAD(P)/FAD-dependent oxidoreductase [Prochlorococcus]|uniref:Geranylgeranyl bacteriochlorophyll reductase-like protein n=1 Tax=Prochlorococcus marinus (strain SARG / CCMP1375 / SS120) TaxID=167539 RepID=Q7VD63_PROMA|nr:MULTISPECIES: NAD(P)/FAD-dependent oxidoreductase [Prochlorococcus]AAP99565.1 geranylgeranyl bacteriochlorophyll reductase-like protein [Prochlorococcus marinus subsp. marinus str. CCMP1375]KGG11163.1 Geranylgeranyl reductase [Prochlorococcus marinus str. LG]KGG21501.1 Geranylgeranyl reductase [Prochlorococcus marinus str. SS2]KGG23154.1 Geranylgeranyl reductase [Prochlorococcus marinus str. SS35]KGG33865.1 Geranylgeranyl reductase [Prochlorococcus marinus str. SS51]